MRIGIWAPNEDGRRDAYLPVYLGNYATVEDARVEQAKESNRDAHWFDYSEVTDQELSEIVDYCQMGMERYRIILDCARDCKF